MAIPLARGCRGRVNSYIYRRASLRHRSWSMGEGHFRGPLPQALAEKPVGVLKGALACCPRGDKVLDTFLASGSTGVKRRRTLLTTNLVLSQIG